MLRHVKLRERQSTLNEEINLATGKNNVVKNPHNADVWLTANVGVSSFVFRCRPSWPSIAGQAPQQKLLSPASRKSHARARVHAVVDHCRLPVEASAATRRIIPPFGDDL